MRVLIADDEKNVANMLATVVSSYGHEVVDVVGSGLEAIRSFTHFKPDLVLMDFLMSRFNGITASRMILSHYPMARIVILSGHLNLDDLPAMNCGAVASLAKPFSIERLKSLLDSLEMGAADGLPS